MRKLLALVATVALGGCATWGQMDDGLTALQGRHLDEAIQVLGYPSGERDIAGRRLVVWSNQSSGVLFMPQTASTYGNVYAGNTMAYYNQTTSYSSMVPTTYQCEIILRVDEHDIVQGYQYSGNMGGCSRYIDSLRRLAR